MGEGLKQRLLGAIALLLLLVVLAPVLFSGGESHPIVTNAENDASDTLPPPVPVFTEWLEQPSDPVVVAIPSNEVEPQSLVQANTGADDKGRLQAWSLRLATFSEQTNAESLKANLQKKGFTAYINKVASDNGKIFYRVYIGPEVNPETLSSVRLLLQKEMGLEGVVVRFVP